MGSPSLGNHILPSDNCSPGPLHSAPIILPIHDVVHAVRNVGAVLRKCKKGETVLCSCRDMDRVLELKTYHTANHRWWSLFSHTEDLEHVLFTDCGLPNYQYSSTARYVGRSSASQGVSNALPPH